MATLHRFLKVFFKRGLHLQSRPQSPQPLQPWQGKCSLMHQSLSYPGARWHPPTSFPHHIPVFLFLCFESSPSTGPQVLPCPPGLEFGSREDMTNLKCEKRKEIGCTVPKPGALRYYALSQTQGERQANPEDKGGKSHCKQRPTFSPHVL